MCRLRAWWLCTFRRPCGLATRARGSRGRCSPALHTKAATRQRGSARKKRRNLYQGARKGAQRRRSSAHRRSIPAQCPADSKKRIPELTSTPWLARLPTRQRRQAQRQKTTHGLGRCRIVECSVVTSGWATKRCSIIFHGSIQHILLMSYVAGLTSKTLQATTPELPMWFFSALQSSRRKTRKIRTPKRGFAPEKSKMERRAVRALGTSVS